MMRRQSDPFGIDAHDSMLNSDHIAHKPVKRIPMIRVIETSMIDEVKSLSKLEKTFDKGVITF